jgi:hypothetical protein
LKLEAKCVSRFVGPLHLWVHYASAFLHS